MTETAIKKWPLNLSAHVCFHDPYHPYIHLDWKIHPAPGALGRLATVGVTSSGKVIQQARPKRNWETDGLLGVAGMMISSDDWDHSISFPKIPYV